MLCRLLRDDWLRVCHRHQSIRQSRAESLQVPRTLKKFTAESADRVRASKESRLKAIYHAPYSVESNHWMRKPNPGMLEAAAKDHRLDLKQSWMVGDRMSDVVAGHTAGCRSILLDGVEGAPSKDLRAPEAQVADLLSAAQFILKQS